MAEDASSLPVKRVNLTRYPQTVPQYDPMGVNPVLFGSFGAENSSYAPVAGLKAGPTGHFILSPNGTFTTNPLNIVIFNMA